MTRWLVTGAGGMLGRGLLGVLAGEPVCGLTRAQLDITHARAVRDAVAGVDVVLNAAAWTDVDGAESAEEPATLVNGVGPRNLAVACRESGARLIHVSTDYVFAGDATRPYAEDAATAPATAYGRSKLAGERAVLAEHPDGSYVVRTAWLYGEHGPNFVRTMIRLERERETLDVVDDQRGQPTWAGELAARLVGLASSEAPVGVYHLSGGGEATWYDLARAVFSRLGADPGRVRPTTTDKFPRPAARPAYSVLGQARWDATGMTPMPSWLESLALALPRMVA